MIQLWLQCIRSKSCQANMIKVQDFFILFICHHISPTSTRSVSHGIKSQQPRQELYRIQHCSVWWEHKSIAVGLHRSTTEMYTVLLYNNYTIEGVFFVSFKSMLVIILVGIVQCVLWRGVKSHFDCVLIVFAMPRVSAHLWRDARDGEWYWIEWNVWREEKSFSSCNRLQRYQEIISVISSVFPPTQKKRKKRFDAEWPACHMTSSYNGHTNGI